MKIYLKKARLSDSHFIFKLKSSKEVRKISINKKKIKYKSHIGWFKKKLKEKKSLFFIICEKKSGINLGHVRLDYENFYFRVTIAIVKNKTGLSFAYQALKEVERKINFNSILFAQVVKSNIRSTKLFKKSNYKEVGFNKDLKFFAKFINKRSFSRK